MQNSKKEIVEVILTEQEIKERIAQMAKEIEADYDGELPIMICALKGGTIFYTDLIREFSKHVDIHFIWTSSYGDGMTSTREVKILNNSCEDVEGKKVLVVDDIVDSGHTAVRVTEFYKALGASEVKMCALLDKPSSRDVDFDADYIGFEIPGHYVVGYGLNLADRYRNTKYIGKLSFE